MKNKMLRGLMAAAFGGLLLLAGSGLRAQVPARPTPPRLVNDLAGIFTASQRQTLERELVAFNDSTSNQIAVVTLPSLGGYAAADMAYEIGKQWGVGQAEFDNGLVVLVKPKSQDEKGEVFIATGYGLEGAIPDAVCKRIIEDEMIPHFREDDYYGGVEAALKVLKALAVGEIKADNYLDDDIWALIVGLGVILLGIMLVIVALAVAAEKKNKDGFNGGGDGDVIATLGWLWLLSHSGNGSHSGSWGGFSGGGGFGGFGGGSFGGGGAGGSW